MIHLKISLFVALFATQGWANDTMSGVIEQAELLAHERLERVRQNPETKLTPFTTDGCSGGQSATWDLLARLFPEFAEIHMAVPPWEECCVAHDRAYHLGSEETIPSASYDSRLAADETLRICVRATGDLRRDFLKLQYGVSDSRIDQAYDLISASMFDAVRLGGVPCSGLPWRWGYGWPNCGLNFQW